MDTMLFRILSPSGILDLWFLLLFYKYKWYIHIDIGHTTPHFEAMIVDIKIPEGQGRGIIRDKTRTLIVRKKTFLEKRVGVEDP